LKILGGEIMVKIDRAFVNAGLVFLVLGMLLGFYMGASGDNKYLDVHVAILLGGFVVLTFYGVIYRLWPVLKDGPLVKAQFWIALIGALTVAVGAGLIVNQMGVAVAAIGSALAIIGAVLMLWIFSTRAGEA
jgi:hypothetical protein